MSSLILWPSNEAKDDPWVGRGHYFGWLSLSISAHWKWLPEVQGWHLEGPEVQGQGLGGVWPASKPLGIQPGAHRHPPAGSHPESHQMTPGEGGGSENVFFLSAAASHPSLSLPYSWKSKSRHRSSCPGHSLVGTELAYHMPSSVQSGASSVTSRGSG